MTMNGVDDLGDVEDNFDEEDDDMMVALADATGGVHVDVSGDDFSAEQNTTMEDFSDIFQKAKKELYPGCKKFSVLTFIVKLMHIKVLNCWSNKSFDMLLQLLKEAFSEGTIIGKSIYEVKRMLRELGLGYESIDACKWDCALFWKENKDLDKCVVNQGTNFTKLKVNMFLIRFYGIFLSFRDCSDYLSLDILLLI